MDFAARLTDIITTALRTRDVEGLRDSLIDETDAAHEAPERFRRVYMLVWHRLSEFDYGHIDDGRLLFDLDQVASDLSFSMLLVRYARVSATAGRVAATISKPFRSVGPRPRVSEVWTAGPEVKTVNLVRLQSPVSA
jgi:hypothetical protein